MQLTFYGADKEVTGSCHCLTVNGTRILIDCGLQQGADETDNAVLPFLASSIDYVLVTHAHIDHSGRLPLLVKRGFHGEILATRKTCYLLSIMLRDSAHIQEMDAETEARKGRRAGRQPKGPLYTLEDAEDTLKLLSHCEYGEFIELCKGVRVRFTDAGHWGVPLLKFGLRRTGKQRRLSFPATSATKINRSSGIRSTSMRAVTMP